MKVSTPFDVDRRREGDDEILRSRLRTDSHATSGRRPTCRRRGCLSSLCQVNLGLLRVYHEDNFHSFSLHNTEPYQTFG